MLTLSVAARADGVIEWGHIGDPGNANEWVDGRDETAVPPPKATSVRLTEHIYWITLSFGLRSNTGVSVGPDGVLVVDTGEAPVVQRLKSAVEALGRASPEYIVNTHLHKDHTGGNDVLGASATLIHHGSLQQRVAEGVLTPGKRPLKGRSGRTFDTYYSMNFNDEEIQLIPTPGAHSDADLLVHFTGSGVVQMGDLLLSQSFPAVPHNVKKYVEILDTVIDVFPSETRFIAGHGRDCSMDDLKQYRATLREMLELVRGEMEVGKSVEQMRCEDLLEKWESCGEFLPSLGTDYWIAAVHDSYATGSDSLSPPDQKPGAELSESGEQPGECRGRIAFYSTRAGHDEIYVIDADGSDLRRLTTGNANGQCPAFSPYGRRIVFQMNRGANKDIYLMDTDGRNVQRLTDSPSTERHAAWSPDGSRIAFQSDRDGNPELYIMDANGSDWRRLTHDPAEEVHPSWSPDGKQIAFNSDRDGNWAIYIVNIDGTGLRRLTDTPGWELCPAWSPDGTKIAFRSGRAKVFEGDIHVICPDGTGERKLTHAAGMEEHPAWSPDGKHLAFQAMKGGAMDIYVMDSASGPWRNLSQHRGHDYWPTWAPAEAGALLGKQKKLPISPHDVRLQIVYDNNAHTKNLQAAAGFSCLIRIKDRTLLFDTGGNGRTLLSNMAELAIDPAGIDQIVLSHNHSDHVCGLPQLLEECKPPEVYLLVGLPNNVSGLGVELVTQAIERAKQQAGTVVEITDPVEISDHVFTTGRMGTRIPEQALIVRTRAGLIVITGCGHPGVVEVVKRARELLGEDVLLVMGGFHLVGKDMADVQETVSELRQLTSHVAPCHCSGDTARELFKKAFESRYVEVGVGKTINPGKLAGQ